MALPASLFPRGAAASARALPDRVPHAPTPSRTLLLAQAREAVAAARPRHRAPLPRVRRPASTRRPRAPPAYVLAGALSRHLALLPPAEASECLARIYESFVAQSTVATWLRGRADARIAGIAMCTWVPKVDVRLHNVVTPAGVGRIESRHDLTVAGTAASIITAG